MLWYLWYCDVNKMWCEEIHSIKKFKLFVLSFLKFEIPSIISFLKTTMIVKVWKIKWKVWKFWGPHVVLMVKNPPANAGDTGLIPGSGRSPGEGKDNPLQYSCLENSTGRGAWRAAIYGAAKSWTQLSDWEHTQGFIQNAHITLTGKLFILFLVGIKKHK